MHFNQKLLKKIAQDTVNKRVHENRSIVAAYLHGSLPGGDPFLGGAADIDLVFIHDFTPPQSREIQYLTDEIHLDIAHHAQKEYRKGRELRYHPWMGPTIFYANILYDPRHFMDFTQAAVRGLYHRADNIFKRSQPLFEHAQQIWLTFQLENPVAGPDEISTYFRAVDHAVNSIAILSGTPLTERRFLLNFPERAAAVGRPGMYAGLLGLLGGPRVKANTLRSWLPLWETTLNALPQDGVPPRLHPHRRVYYLRAFKAILDSDRPLNMLWPLLRTWTLAVCALPPGHPAGAGWRDAVLHLGLLGSDFSERVAAFGAYLELVEETKDNWAEEQGV